MTPRKRFSYVSVEYAVVLALLATPLTSFAQQSPCPFVWNQNLKVGAQNADVVALQQFLNSDAATQIALTGPGSPGMETTKFGAMTKKAVIAFQNKYASEILVPNGLSTGSGVVGLATRAKLNALCVAPKTATTTGAVLGAATTTVPSVASSTPTLLVTSAEQPATTLAPANALYVPFTNVTLTAQGGDVVVHDISIERIGPGQDQAFADWDLLDSDGNYYGLGYFDSYHHSHITKDHKDLTISAGTSVTLNLVGDMAIDLSSYDGQMAGLQVDSINASAPVVGTLPVRGTLQTMNASLVIGTPYMTLSPLDPMGDHTRYIGDTGITFAGVRITPDSQEDEKLTSIAWRQIGSAAAQDFQNVSVVINGTVYPTTADGNVYTASLGDGIVIHKGNAIDAVLRGDLTISGSRRTVQFEINDGSDVALTGLTYGFGLFPIPSDHTDTLVSGHHSVFVTSDGSTDGDIGRPFFVGSVTTISNGAAVSIGK